MLLKSLINGHLFYQRDSGNGTTPTSADQNRNQNAESGKPEKVISTLTIYFKSPEGAEPSAETADENSVNPLTQAMENVAQGAASDLAQTNVEGNEE